MMKNNIVAKHDYNVGGFHKDQKNDYNRETSIEWELDQLYEDRINIAIEQYEELNGNFDSNNS